MAQFASSLEAVMKGTFNKYSNKFSGCDFWKDVFQGIPGCNVEMKPESLEKRCMTEVANP